MATKKKPTKKATTGKKTSGKAERKAGKSTSGAGKGSGRMAKDVSGRAESGPKKAVDRPKSPLPAEMLEALRHRLLERKSSLLEEVNKILGAGESSGKHRSVEVMDMASDSFDDDLAMSLARNEMEEIHAIDEAIGQIDEGTYGICEACATAIEPRRLDALPFATLCISCKKRMEIEGVDHTGEWGGEDFDGFGGQD